MTRRDSALLDQESVKSSFAWMAKGGRGKGENKSTFGPDGDETMDNGSWMSIWVDRVDEVYSQALDAGIEVVFPPEDMPWGARECHIRHPDGHVFRISQ